MTQVKREVNHPDSKHVVAVRAGVRVISGAAQQLRSLLRSGTGEGELLNYAFLRQAYSDLFPEQGEIHEKELLHRYVANVTARRLDPNPHFSEIGYLAHNFDIRPIVRSGEYVSGFHHWLAKGRGEDRTGWSKPGYQGNIDGMDPDAPLFRFSPISSFKLPPDLSRLSNEQCVSILSGAGIFDRNWYLAKYPDLRKGSRDPLEHYVSWGQLEGRLIHPLFDDEYYKRNNPEYKSGSVLPIIHYIIVGARAGANPHPLIDTKQYSRKHSLDLRLTNPLAHFNMSHRQRSLIETPHFDQEYYTKRHPRSEEFPGGPFMHFMHLGVHAGYRPSDDFNTRYYYSQYLNNNFQRNAYLHFLEIGKKSGYKPIVGADVPTLPREVAYFSNPGPDFEEIDRSIAKGREKLSKLIAFYLPQYHSFAENDLWWGKGFTEWRNLPRGLPRFAGHYQPRIPRDLGFYDLTEPLTLRRQVELALDMGLWAFCFYFYWFDRHRLMERPLDAFLSDKTLDMPFMLLWANENWTRRWDGGDDHVLIEQHYDHADDDALVDCFMQYFSDSRYVRLSGRPFIVIYRADAIPNIEDKLHRWREIFRDKYDENPLIFMAQSFDCLDPNEFGFDGAIEFPPHKIGQVAPDVSRDQHMFDWDFEGSVRTYDDAVSISLSEPSPNFPLAKTVFPSWDNNARRQNGGMVFRDSTPLKFEKWLGGAIRFSIQNPIEGENIVFINAWNEWAEGAYLEPDIHLGGAMLNKLAAAVVGGVSKADSGKFKLLLIGHDAFPAGAQRNLLHLARMMAQEFGVEVRVLLLAGGALLPQYEEAVPTKVCSVAELEKELIAIAGLGFRRALLNTVVSGAAAEQLKSLGFTIVSLVHEMPTLIRQYELEQHVFSIRTNADHVVFATDSVKEAFVSRYGDIGHAVHTKPQGIYNVFEKNQKYRDDIRRELGLDLNAPIILNVAYGDLRKGLDLFCQVANLSYLRKLDLQFVWVGDIDTNLKGWLPADLARRGINNIHFLENKIDVGPFMNAADVFFLSSREDPFPSVVLEAMQVGLPVLAFEAGGGFVDMLRDDARLGALTQQGDPEAVLTQLQTMLRAEKAMPSDVDYRIDRARSDFNFRNYAFDLLKLFDPNLRKLSVAVPNYNYEHFLRARLETIFDQSYPIYEILVFDDASTDASLAEIEATTTACNRTVQVHSSSMNSGSAFGQWQSILQAAKGELLWIAEADDLSDREFAEALVNCHVANSDCLMAFSDSRSVDRDGYGIYQSYIPYLRSVFGESFERTSVFESNEFARNFLTVANPLLNLSSVVWNTAAIGKSYREMRSKTGRWRLVEDWMLYLLACRQSGTVCYVATALNVHRRHSQSVTNSLSMDEHLREIAGAQKSGAKIFGSTSKIRAAQKTYMKATQKWLSGDEKTT